VKKQRLAKGQAPRSSLSHLAEFLDSAMENTDVMGVAFIATKESDNLMVEQWDMRSSEILDKVWRQFNANIFCSGTLVPLDAFAEIAGLGTYAASIVPSTYTSRNVLSLVTKGLSTKGEKLDKKMADAYIDSIESFLKAMKNRNIAVFFSSYRIQNALIRSIADLAKSYGKQIFIEYKGMAGKTCRQMLDEFKEKGGILCGVMAGRFAEGADFPGKELEGIFLVGIPFDQVNLKTKLYLNYYSKLYGSKGRYYGYIVPALRRASQALGRALRSEEDRAVLVLGDERYANRMYFSLLPQEQVAKKIITTQF
jgi:DNA excision repair protein ERCC-2